MKLLLPAPGDTIHYPSSMGSFKPRNYLIKSLDYLYGSDSLVYSCGSRDVAIRFAQNILSGTFKLIKKS